MVWMGCLEHPFAKWNSLIGSRYLRLPVRLSSEQRQKMGLTFAKVGDLPLGYDASGWYLVMKL